MDTDVLLRSCPTPSQMYENTVNVVVQDQGLNTNNNKRGVRKMLLHQNLNTASDEEIIHVNSGDSNTREVEEGTRHYNNYTVIEK